MDWLRRTARPLTSLPRLLYLLFFLKVLESYAYFITSLNLTLYATEAFGLSDVDAGWVYGTWGMTAGIAGVCAGPAIDYLGVRLSLFVGGLVSLLGRFMFAFAYERTAALFGLYFLQSIGLALGIPVLSIGVRRCTQGSPSQPMAFGLFYSCMNVGALMAGLATDKIFEYGSVSHLTPNLSLRTMMQTAAGASCAYVVLLTCTWSQMQPFVLPEHAVVSAADGAASIDEESQRSPRQTAWSGPVPTCTYTSIMNTYKNKLFWKLTLFSLALFGARSIFRHQDATLPKWMERTIDAKAHYGDIYSINPAMIIFLVPLLQHVLRAYDSYDTVTAGTLVIAIAPTVLSVANPSYTAAAFFMIIMSLGEAIYSPRSTQYVLSLAPVGGEGVFGVLAAVPLFMVKVLTGGMSGNLLDTYCPANDTSRCKMVWTFIGVVASTSFLSLLLARKWLRVPNGPYPSRALFDDTDVHAHIERYGNSDSDDAEILSDGSDPDDTALQHAEPVYGTPNDDDRLYAITTDHIQPRRKSKT